MPRAPATPAAGVLALRGVWRLSNKFYATPDSIVKVIYIQMDTCLIGLRCDWCRERGVAWGDACGFPSIRLKTQANAEFRAAAGLYSSRLKVVSGLQRPGAEICPVGYQFSHPMALINPERNPSGRPIGGGAEASSCEAKVLSRPIPVRKPPLLLFQRCERERGPPTSKNKPYPVQSGSAIENSGSGRH